MQAFPTFLESFNHIHHGGPVDKALVVRDCDRNSIDEVRQQMEKKLGNHTYLFPVELCVVRRCLDTWLLADEGAITAVALQHAGRKVGPIQEALEEIDNAKGRLMRVLSSAHLPYSPGILGEIADLISLETLNYRVPSFADFRDRVNKGLQ
jgi:hypothetical protein